MLKNLKNLIAFIGLAASAQTGTINLATQARNPDFSAMPVTRPVTVGTTLPTTCAVGQLYFLSSAATGNNLWGCPVDKWVPMIGSATSTGASSGNAVSLQGILVSPTPPLNHQALIYNSTSLAYEPVTFYSISDGMGTAATGIPNLRVDLVYRMHTVAVGDDKVLATDCGGVVIHKDSTPLTVSLSQAGLGDFYVGCPIYLTSTNTAGVMTVLPSGSNIGGATSLNVPPGKGCLIAADAKDWQLLVSCN